MHRHLALDLIAQGARSVAGGGVGGGMGGVDRRVALGAPAALANATLGHRLDAPDHVRHLVAREADLLQRRAMLQRPARARRQHDEVGDRSVAGDGTAEVNIVNRSAVGVGGYGPASTGSTTTAAEHVVHHAASRC